MDPDDRVDLLQELEEEDANALLSALERREPEAAEEVRELVHYEPETAGGLMTTEFVALDPSDDQTMYTNCQNGRIVRYDRRTGERKPIQPQLPPRLPRHNFTPVMKHPLCNGGSPHKSKYHAIRRSS